MSKSSIVVRTKTATDEREVVCGRETRERETEREREKRLTEIRHEDDERNIRRRKLHSSFKIWQKVLQMCVIEPGFEKSENF